MLPEKNASPNCTANPPMKANGDGEKNAIPLPKLDLEFSGS
jgi:hypothetical protein